MIDWTKPVRTKGDRLPVRILCTDAPGMFPVVGLCEWYVATYPDSRIERRTLEA